jgi:hypothetical protein
MEQKEKELLLKDLTARLPYNTIVQIKNSGIWNLKGIDQDNFDEIGYKVIVWHGKNYPSSKTSFPITICKPYLFPLSSMTNEQKLYLEWHTKYRLDDGELVVKKDEDDEYLNTNMYDYLSLIEWLNKNHFDYQGLIERGLAIDATGLNIY